MAGARGVAGGHPVRWRNLQHLPARSNFSFSHKFFAAKLEAARALTFGAATKQLVDTHQLSWRNAKHAAQWRTVFEGSLRAPAATAVINDLPVGSVSIGFQIGTPNDSQNRRVDQVASTALASLAFTRGYRAAMWTPPAALPMLLARSISPACRSRRLT
jgi:hypothetical protein